ncbi:MAG TPA: DnaJ domain-containing protein [Gelria sp.]|nr:DnaJ domain-containing protein [Gelria sp.]
MNDAIGKTCPYCQTPIKPGEQVVFCSACSIPHHLECWNEGRGCTTFGCNGHSTAEPSNRYGRTAIDIEVNEVDSSSAVTRTTFRPDYYVILQVDKHASPEVVNAAYNQLLSIHNPGSSENNRQIQLIQEAYEVLGDPQNRWHYDSWLDNQNIFNSWEKHSPKLVGIDNNLESVSQVRPWVRYLARFIDIYAFGVILGFIIGIVCIFEEGAWEILELPSAMLGIIIICLYPFIEALFLSNWGTTPGKWMLNTKVLNKCGEHLSYMEALIRSYRVAWQGLGLGLPIVSLVTSLIGYSNLKNNSITRWDANLETVVIHKKIGVTRIIIAIIVIITFFALAIYGSV